MVGFIGRRLLQSIPTLILISLLLFFGMQAVPGGPLSAFAFRPGMSNAARNAIIHQWGLDQPVYVQYLQWVKSILTGPWQLSFFMHRPVCEPCFQRLQASLILIVTAYIAKPIIAPP